MPPVDPQKDLTRPFSSALLLYPAQQRQEAARQRLLMELIDETREQLRKGELGAGEEGLVDDAAIGALAEEILQQTYPGERDDARASWVSEALWEGATHPPERWQRGPEALRLHREAFEASADRPDRMAAKEAMIEKEQEEYERARLGDAKKQAAILRGEGVPPTSRVAPGDEALRQEAAQKRIGVHMTKRPVYDAQRQRWTAPTAGGGQWEDPTQEGPKK